MTKILHDNLPTDLQPGQKLPGVRPLQGDAWLRVDEAYAAQMAYRRDLIAHRRDQVLYQPPESRAAMQEVLAEALKKLPSMGFSITSRHIFCPDGVKVDIESDGPLAVLGQAVQEDICIMIKQGDEHVLAAAVVCFPANWTLSEKAGRPLSSIHGPVDSYDADLGRRVQRMFDLVRAEQPLWRNNYLRYANPALFQQQSENIKPSKHGTGYVRAERQCIAKLPVTGAVVFSIHTYVVSASAVS
ncbi:MAG: DUF3445 domain-containing protein [Roseobacter sp.]